MSETLAVISLVCSALSLLILLACWIGVWTDRTIEKELRRQMIRAELIAAMEAREGKDG